MAGSSERTIDLALSAVNEVCHSADGEQIPHFVRNDKLGGRLGMTTKNELALVEEMDGFEDGVAYDFEAAGA